jgi:hypothetical protein
LPFCASFQLLDSSPQALVFFLQPFDLSFELFDQTVASRELSLQRNPLLQFFRSHHTHPVESLHYVTR